MDPANLLYHPSPAHPLALQAFQGTPVTLTSVEHLALFQEATPLHAYLTQVLGVTLAIDHQHGQLFLRGRPDDVSKAVNAVHQAVPANVIHTAGGEGHAKPHLVPLPLPPNPYQQYHPFRMPFAPPHHQQYYEPMGGDLGRLEEGFCDGADLTRENQVVFAMYEKDTARLIGRRGAHLHQLQDETGARIQVDSHVPPGAPRTVYVWGTTGAIDHALVKIFNKLRRTGEPFLPVPKPSASFADREARREVHPLEIEYEWPVEIPVGKKPFLSLEVVKEIEQNSGASISFHEEEDSDTPEILKLMVKGAPLPIHYAVAALFDQVDGDLTEPTQIEPDTEYPNLEAWLKEPVPQYS